MENHNRSVIDPESEYMQVSDKAFNKVFSCLGVMLVAALVLVALYLLYFVAPPPPPL